MSPQPPSTPKRSLAECNAILTSPGMPYEMDLAVIDGRVLRVYKNQHPNLRAFWLEKCAAWGDKPYIVFERDGYTYGQVHERASRLASLLRSTYGVRKGDRVAIAMRNFPEYIISFWAIHLLGAVATLINAWSPTKPLLFCVRNTDPKVLIVDPERADRIAGQPLEKLKEGSQLKKVLVVRTHESKHKWEEISDFDNELEHYVGAGDAWKQEEEALPEDDATIFFTSGTTGFSKGVLSTHRGFIQNVINAAISQHRSILRRGEDIPPPDDSPKAALIGVPLFHVSGCTSTLMAATSMGAKVVLMRRWDKEEAARLILAENITKAGGVPSMIMDLLDSSLQSSPLEALSCGGAPVSNTMAKEVQRRFPNVALGQGYGLSETNAIAANIHGEDFLARPDSAGIAPPVVDIIIVDPVSQLVQAPGQIGEVWIRGPNVMKGYWNDPNATKNTITPEGWLKSGDLATMDEEGYLYILDRAKDIIIRGGENIHSVEVENALYADDRLIDAAAVSVPDRRLGELVAAVVTTKHTFHGKVTEDEVIAIARKSLPAYAFPVMVLIRSEPIERNPTGKILKDVVRKQVREEWARRQKSRGKARL